MPPRFPSASALRRYFSRSESRQQIQPPYPAPKHTASVNPRPQTQQSASGFRGPFVSSIGLYLVTHLFMTYCFAVQSTVGPSMLPTIGLQGDWVLTNKFHRRGKGVKTGDMVALKSPWVEGRTILKRIVGMPGDFVKYEHVPQLAGETGTIGGEEARLELFKWQERAKAQYPEPRMVQVPQGHCWILGDNLDWSRDSRLFGPVPLALINGKIVARVFPWRERCWFENPMQAAEQR